MAPERRGPKTAPRRMHPLHPAHQDAASTPVRDAPVVSGPPIDDKLLSMWRWPLALRCRTMMLPVSGRRPLSMRFSLLANNWPSCGFATGSVRRACLCVASLVVLAADDVGPNSRDRARRKSPSSTVETDRVCLPPNDLRWMMLARSWSRNKRKTSSRI